VHPQGERHHVTREQNTSRWIDRYSCWVFYGTDFKRRFVKPAALVKGLWDSPHYLQANAKTVEPAGLILDRHSRAC